MGDRLQDLCAAAEPGRFSVRSHASRGRIGHHRRREGGHRQNPRARREVVFMRLPYGGGFAPVEDMGFPGRNSGTALSPKPEAPVSPGRTTPRFRATNFPEWSH